MVPSSIWNLVFAQLNSNGDEKAVQQPVFIKEASANSLVNIGCDIIQEYINPLH